VRIRRLEKAERTQWLDLLDGWELLDGWRGCDFFRRSIEDDPSYDDANVWVAEEASRLVCSVQIFPRELMACGVRVPTGGIGTVYTRSDRRGEGVASAVLERSIEDMRARGMEISLLFAARTGFYERLGWRSWPMRRELLRRSAGAPPRPWANDLFVESFAPARDLDAVVALHSETALGLSGGATRDAAAWRGSLRLAGNPTEEFLVARAGRNRTLLAYARAIRLNEVLTIAEHGLRDAEAMAVLCEAILAPRTPDGLAPAGKPSAAFRSFAVLSVAAEPGLRAALERRGFVCSPIEDSTPMLRCLDAQALARRLRLPAASDASSDSALSRAFPPERFGYWLTDRF
jgi:GNAT superfamily N-acetyltransferase